MQMKLADTIASHPKFLRAGELLSPQTGVAEALALYVAAVGYARHFLTDGFVSDAFVAQTAVVSRGEKVAKALTAPDVRLWHRVKGGYKIHDFFDWNGKSKDIKEKRRDEASRVKHYRATKRSKRS